MAKPKTSVRRKRWPALLAALRAAAPRIIETTQADTGMEPDAIAPALERILELIAEPRVSAEREKALRAEGIRLARAGAAAEQTLDMYLSLNWVIWEAAVEVPGIDPAVILELADRLMKGMDAAIAAMAEGYVIVEVELAAAHSERRRSFLEELLSAPRATPEDRARINRRAVRHGLGVDDSYRLILVLAPGRGDEAQDDAVDRLESRIRVPVPHHRGKPGIRLPVVLEWRGRILVIASGAWAGEPRLREALPKVLGDEWIAVDSGPVEGIEALDDALAQVEFSITVAASLGRIGWIDDPDHLALETTFLLDDELVHSAIEQELGPLLADERMGEELIDTLEVYLGARQNIRETARRLHLAPRTVAYRLARIRELLGRELEGDVSVRLAAALLALKVNRQAGRA